MTNINTIRYELHGLPPHTTPEVRKAWEDYLRGECTSPLRMLPTNGDTCMEKPMGGPYCGYPLLIDGSCPNRSDHYDVVMADQNANIEEEDQDEQPWHDAGLEVDAAWDSFQRARNPIEFANAVVRMNNAMANMITWLPGYNYETGRVENYEDS